MTFQHKFRFLWVPLVSLLMAAMIVAPSALAGANLATVSPATRATLAATSSASPTSSATASTVATTTPTATTVPGATATPSATMDVNGEDVCSTVVLGKRGVVPNPTPSTPVQSAAKVCDGGNIEVEVSSSSRFGNRIGDVINVDVKITVDPEILLDFTSLSQGVLKLQAKSQLTLALENPVTIVGPELKDGKNVYHIQVRVQNMLPVPASFSLDLRYRIGSDSSGWKVLTTPDYLLTNSITVDSGANMLDGDLSTVPVNQPWPLKPLLFAVFLLIALPLANEIRIWAIRQRPGYVPTATEAAWRMLNPVLNNSQPGFTIGHAQIIELALRRYLVQDYPAMPSMTRQEVAARMAQDARSEKVIRVLSLCDHVLYQVNSEGTLIVIAGDDADELKTLLKQLIPEEG
ncbi:hypothetical protein BH10CYA1_BH10CYA1_17600 [soil metagenome]